MDLTTRTGTHHDIQVSFVGFLDGRSLLTIDREGTPLWLACELAPLCGFDSTEALEEDLIVRGRGLCREGVHYVWVNGLELAQLKRRIQRQPGELHPDLASADKAMLVTEAGALHVSYATRPRLRAYLRDKARPEHEARVRARKKAHDLGDHAVLHQALLELERRRVDSEVLSKLVDELEERSDVSPDVLLSYRIAAAEIALGTKLNAVKPRLDHGWLTPTQIADRYLGLTLQTLGKVITGLGLRHDSSRSKAVLNKARGHEKTVVSYLYSPQAVREIDETLEQEGFRRVDSAA